MPRTALLLLGLLVPLASHAAPRLSPENAKAQLTDRLLEYHYCADGACRARVGSAICEQLALLDQRIGGGIVATPAPSPTPDPRLDTQTLKLLQRVYGQCRIGTDEWRAVGHIPWVGYAPDTREADALLEAVGVETLQLAIGERKELELPANPTLGQVWRVATRPNPAVVKFHQQGYASVGNYWGAAIHDHWSLEGVAAGESVLVLDYAMDGGFPPPEAPLDRRLYRIVVR